jgi:glucose-1-phosphate thymidylyltransferase
VILVQAGGSQCEHARDVRKRHSGHLLPTSLLPVANRPLLRHALDWLAASGVRSTVVVVPEAIAKDAREAVPRGSRPIVIQWLERLPGESLADTLSAVAGFLEDEPFILHLADSLARQGLRSLTKSGPADRFDAMILVQEEPPSRSGNVIDLRHHLEPEDPRFRVPRGAPAGVALLGAGALEAVAALEPARRRFEAFADRLLALGGTVRACPVHEWWRFRGGAGALLEGNRFALDGLRADFDPALLVNSVVQGSVVIHRTAHVESSTIRGPAVIGPGAQVCEAYVGPYTSIGERAVIEGAEIEHSVIFAGASIKHLGGRLDASVVGRDARIFRDFRLPRAFRLEVGEGANVSLA